MRILPTNAGPCGRCCHFASSCGNTSEGFVPELSLEFCATVINGVQVKLQSTELISVFERLQLVLEGLKKPLAHQRTKVVYQGIVGMKDEPLALAFAPHQTGLTQLARLRADV